MKTVTYELFRGFINRYVSSGTFTRPQQFTPATLSGEINEWLDKGFAIHENPCRKEFLAARVGTLPPYQDVLEAGVGKEVSAFDQTRKTELFFPFGNIGYDASFFYHCPTYLRTYCAVQVNVPEAEEAEAELSTCGGMTVWVNGTPVTDFVPFTRNLVKKTRVTLPFAAGANRLVVCLDDLAERDTDYYFRIRYLGSQTLTMELPLPEGAEPEAVKHAERVLDSLHFTRESYCAEDVCVCLGEQPAAGETIVAASGGNTFKPAALPAEGAGAVYRVAPSAAFPPAYTPFSFSIACGGVTITRRAGCQVADPDQFAHASDDIAKRRLAYLNMMARQGADEVTEFARPYNIYQAAAILAVGGSTEEAEKAIRAELVKVNAREDCSDFLFAVILHLYRFYADVLSEEILEEIHQAALNYRYWIDEPGDDVMWFFSENHALMFHVCQFMAGSLWPEGFFTNSGRTGRQVREHAEQLLTKWFEGYFEEFITEWNSNAYIPIDVHGLGFLYNFTSEEHPFHAKAKAALDRIARCICLYAHKGTVMASYGRTYERELKANDNTGITTLLYLLYNEGHLTAGGAGNIALALGTYEAPEEYRAYIHTAPEEDLVYENVQGWHRHAALYLNKNEKTSLSTAVLYKPYHGGYQEHIVQAAIDTTAQVFINHPGEVQPYGSGRPAYWAGNGVLPAAMACRNVSVLVYDIPEDNLVDYTHAYAPAAEFDRCVIAGEAAVFEKDGAYIGLRAANGLTMTADGVSAGRELKSPGRQNVWVIATAGTEDFASAEDMHKALLACVIRQDGRTVTVKTPEGTCFSFAEDGSGCVNGVPVDTTHLDQAGEMSVLPHANVL